jgi:predicted alpha-1,6-mannanase (GH76 family)
MEAVDKDTDKHILTYSDYADWAQEVLKKNYWNEVKKSVINTYPYSQEKEKGLNYWWKAHVADAEIDGYERTKNKIYAERAESIIENVFEQNGALYNEFYDDMEWMALACLRLYDCTGSEKMKDYAVKLWEDIKTAWWYDEVGGLAWKKDEHRTSRNACCNGPGALLAARLYQRLKNESDLEWANKIFAFEKNYLVDPENGMVYDGMTVRPDGTISTNKKWLFTYNTGTYIGAAAELYRITGDVNYLKEAEKTADSSMKQLVNEHGVLKSEGTGDGGLFKGILIRYLQKLYEVNNDRKIADFILHNAKKLAQNSSSLDIGFFGPEWNKIAQVPLDVTCQTSGVFLFEAAAKISGDNKLL